MKTRRRSMLGILWALMAACVAITAYCLRPMCYEFRARWTLAKAIAEHKDIPIGFHCRFCEETLGEMNLDLAMDALYRLGAQSTAVPQLIIALQSNSSELRHGAAMHLARIGRDAAPAANALGEALRDEHVFETAVDALERIKPTSSLPFLISWLDDPSLDFRCRVCERIGRLGPSAVVAVPSLIRLLDNDEYGAKNAAGAALANIGRAAVPELRKRAGVSNPRDPRYNASNIAKRALRLIEEVEGTTPP